MTSGTAHEPRSWKFAGACFDGQPFILDGIDVWSQKWRRVFGETAVVKDPRHGQDFRFPVYQFEGKSGSLRIAAGEFSAGVYAFYVVRPWWRFW